MRQVAYFISSPGYLPYLATSVHSLRRNYFGDIHIFAWPESYDLAAKIASDERIGAKAYRVQDAWRESNEFRAQRIHIVRDFPGSTIVLDADTLVARSISPFFYFIEGLAFAGTQFCDMTTEDPEVRQSLLEAKELLPDFNETFEDILSKPYPALSSGVFGVHGTNKGRDLCNFLVQHAVSIRNCRNPEEIAQYVASSKFSEHFGIWPGGEYNQSPAYRNNTLFNDEIVIWHGRGGLFANETKCKKSADMWFREYQRSVSIGQLDSWVFEVAGRRLREFLTKRLNQASF